MQSRFPDLGRDWENEHLENSRDVVFRNTFKDIEHILDTCGPNGTRFEFECYDIGHLYTLAHMKGRGKVSGPLFVQSVFGLLGGIGGHPEDVMMMRRTADRLLGMIMNGRFLGPVPTSCALRPLLRQRAAMCGLGLRIPFGPDRGNWPPAAPSRSKRSKMSCRVLA